MGSRLPEYLQHFLDLVAVVMMTVELVLIVTVALKGKDHLRSANH